MEKICEDNHIMKLQNKKIATEAAPGEFVSILPPGDNSLILRRPFSIMDANPSEGTFDIAFEVRGKGTRLFSECKKGDVLDVMGPLGNGFGIDENYEKIAIVGGGIGIYPLYFLAKTHPAKIKDVFMGCLCGEKAAVGERFTMPGCRLMTATDDGSLGYCGYVTDLFEREYNPDEYDMVYVCGPEAMSRKVVGLVRERGGKCRVSLEERMGCGIGACLVCSCEIKDEDGIVKKTVCKDGPVFDGDQIFPEEC